MGHGAWGMETHPTMQVADFVTSSSHLQSNSLDISVASQHLQLVWGVQLLRLGTFCIFPHPEPKKGPTRATEI
jgi:hypothetical protein